MNTINITKETINILDYKEIDRGGQRGARRGVLEAMSSLELREQGVVLVLLDQLLQTALMHHH